MADPPRSPDSGDTGMRPDRASTTGPPRWVKVFVVIAVVVAVLFVLLFVIRGPHRGPGGHGPWRHTGGLGGAHPPTLGVVAPGGRRP